MLPPKYPRKAFRKDSYRIYIRSGGSIGVTTVDINRRKKEMINPLSSFPKYIQYLSSIVSLPRIDYIYSKPRSKQSL